MATNLIICIAKEHTSAWDWSNVTNNWNRSQRREEEEEKKAVHGWSALYWMQRSTGNQCYPMFHSCGHRFDSLKKPTQCDFNIGSWLSLSRILYSIELCCWLIVFFLQHHENWTIYDKIIVIFQHSIWVDACIICFNCFLTL